MRNKTKRHGLVTIGLIVLNIVVLIGVFSFPPMSLSDECRYLSSNAVNNRLNRSNADSFILAELQKGINEIQMRLKDQSGWFQYKFLFVGGLLAAFLGLFPYALLKKSVANEKGRIDSALLLGRALGNQTSTVVLAAICCLSLMIDLHIRGNAIVVNQIGLWIASHVEPLFMETNIFPAGSFVPWETFLRLGGAMHTDVVNSITFFWPIHILTIICFLLYLISQRVTIVKENKVEIKLATLAFWIVHLCLIVLAWTGHYIPPIFQVKLPLVGIQQGVLAALPFTALALLLTMINWCFTVRLLKV